MARNYFLEIHRNIHLNGDYFFQFFCKINKKHWQPSKKVNINETFYLFKEKTKYKQRVTYKFYSTEIKFFILADSDGFI
jgi:hypothetical protein